jgi:hypothetical protein
VFCSSCGHDIKGARFCAQCGAPTPARAKPSPSPPPATEENEHDLVEVLGRLVRGRAGAIVDRRTREAARAIGADTRAALGEILGTPEAQQLGARLREIDVASGGAVSRAGDTISRAGAILVQVLQRGGRGPA